MLCSQFVWFHLKWGTKFVALMAWRNLFNLFFVLCANTLFYFLFNVRMLCVIFFGLSANTLFYLLCNVEMLYVMFFVLCANALCYVFCVMCKCSVLKYVLSGLFMQQTWFLLQTGLCLKYGDGSHIGTHRTERRYYSNKFNCHKQNVKIFLKGLLK